MHLTWFYLLICIVSFYFFIYYYYYFFFFFDSFFSKHKSVVFFLHCEKVQMNWNRNIKLKIFIYLFIYLFPKVNKNTAQLFHFHFSKTIHYGICQKVLGQFRICILCQKASHTIFLIFCIWSKETKGAFGDKLAYSINICISPWNILWVSLELPGRDNSNEQKPGIFYWITRKKNIKLSPNYPHLFLCLHHKLCWYKI